MGVDVYSSRGIIATIDEFLGVVNGKNKRLVVKVCKEFYHELASDAEANKEDDWRQNLAESFKPLLMIPSNPLLDSVRAAIRKVVKVDGEVSKYGECYVENSEYIESLFSQILDVSGFDLPYIQQVTAWGSGRYNGWEVPKGVACVVFNSESCYVKTLSEEGMAVKKFLGHCDETEWSEMSY